MKKIFKTLAIVAVAALGFACQNEIDEQVNGNEGEKVTVEVVGSVADLTRSTFGEINTTDKKVPSTWSGNEQVGFSALASLDKTAENEGSVVAATNTVVAGGDTASFSVEFDAIEKDDTVFAVSPYNSTKDYSKPGFSGITTKYQEFYVTIPATQTPLANSVEEGVHLMVGEATYEGGAMTMTFEHVAAYAKMNIINFVGNGVKSVAVTFPTYVAGQGLYYVYAGEDKGKIMFPSKTENLAATVTINPENVSNFANGVWFTVAPVGALVGDMKVVVTDEDDKTYTKNIALTAEKGISFVKGQVSEFTVNMNGVTEDVVEGSYNRITELSQLTDGCEAVIVAQNGGKYYALTVNADPNKNPAQTEVTVNGETLDNASLKDALVMTVGVSNGNYTFKNGSSYLAWVEKTTMKFGTTSQTFTITANGDYFNVKNTSSERYVAYRSDSSDWRAYTSTSQAATSGAEAALSFYVKGAKADTRLQSSLSFSQESFEVDLNGFSGTFTAPEKTLTPNGGTLTYSSDNTDVATVNVNTGDVTIVGKGTAVITATFAGDENYKGCSASYTIKVFNGAEPIVKEYVWSLLTSQLNGKTSVTQGDVTWAYSVNSGVGYTSTGTDGATSVQIGSNKKPLTSMSFTTSGIVGKIKSITINGANSGSKTNTKMTITVGGVSYCSNVAFTSTNLADYTYNGTSSGEIVISFAGTAAGIKLHQIKVVYEE